VRPGSSPRFAIARRQQEYGRSCRTSTKRLIAERARPSARKKPAPRAPPTPVRPSSRCDDAGCNLPSGRGPRRRWPCVTSEVVLVWRCVVFETVYGRELVVPKRDRFALRIFSLPAERYPTNTCVGYWAGARPLARLPPPSHTLWPKPRRPAGLFICERSSRGRRFSAGSDCVRGRLCRRNRRTRRRRRAGRIGDIP
jgi:hypothetical protein